MKVIRQHLIFLNMLRNYKFAPQTKKLLPYNQKPESSFGVINLGNNFLVWGANV